MKLTKERESAMLSKLWYKIKNNRLWHYHWQNLNEKKSAGNETKYGFFLRDFRGWLTIWPSYKDKYKGLFGIEYQISFKWHGSTGFEIEIGGDEVSYQFHVSTPFFFFYIGFSGIPIPKFMTYEVEHQGRKLRLSQARQIGIKIHSGNIWFDLWAKPMEWNHDDPKWWSFSWNFTDFFFGKRNYSAKTIAKYSAKIAMPEKVYDATLEFKEETWKRRFYKNVLIRCHADIPGGIPFPGKGENSWDCGEDGLFGSTFVCNNPIDAVIEIIKSVMQSRKRYGSMSLNAIEKIGFSSVESAPIVL